MKTLRNTLIAGISGAAALFLMASCQKGFDAKTYDPVKPPPIYGGYSATKQIAPQNLVAYWGFDGTLMDSVSKATGTATGTTFGTGILGKGFQGAANSYAVCDMPKGLDTLKSFTLSEWINTPPPSNGIIGIFSFANTVNFWGNLEVFFENGSSNTNGRVRVHVAQSGSDNTYSVDGVQNLFGAWVNVMVTYSASSGKFTLYVNGASAASGTAGSLKGALAFTNPGKVVFGTTQFMTTPSQTSGTGKQDWASYLTGEIDQVRVYSKALNATQANALYNLEKAGR